MFYGYYILVGYCYTSSCFCKGILPEMRFQWKVVKMMLVFNTWSKILSQQGNLSIIARLQSHYFYMDIDLYQHPHVLLDWTVKLLCWKTHFSVCNLKWKTRILVFPPVLFSFYSSANPVLQGHCKDLRDWGGNTCHCCAQLCDTINIIVRSRWCSVGAVVMHRCLWI